MANPGQYPPPMGGPPMGGPMQPMGGPPMGGPPMGGPPMGGPPRATARQGTSRMVPVVVSAGLAVGVFCGLLFGLGTGKSNAAPAAPVSNGVKRGEDPPPPESVKSSVTAVKTPDKPAAGSNAGSAVAATPATAGSAGSAAAGSDAGNAAPPVAKLVVEIKPDMAGPTAKVTVDDKEIAGLATEVAMEPDVAKKKVKVKVRALGYRDVDQTVEVEVAGETTLKLELVKGRSSLPATPVAGTPPATTDGGTTAAATPPATKTNGGTTSDGGNGKSDGASKATSDGGSKSNGGTKSNGGNKGNTGKGKGKGSGGLIDI